MESLRVISDESVKPASDGIVWCCDMHRIAYNNYEKAQPVDRENVPTESTKLWFFGDSEWSKDNKSVIEIQEENSSVL